MFRSKRMAPKNERFLACAVLVATMGAQLMCANIALAKPHKPHNGKDVGDLCAPLPGDAQLGCIVGACDTLYGPGTPAAQACEQNALREIIRKGKLHPAPVAPIYV